MLFEKAANDAAQATHSLAGVNSGRFLLLGNCSCVALLPCIHAGMQNLHSRRPGDRHNQRGGTFQPLPAPFVTVVTDNGANVVQGARVEYKVISGNGLLSPGTECMPQDCLEQSRRGEPSIISVTDSDGRASAQLTLGGVTGLDAQRVEATLLDGPVSANGERENISAGFTASAFVPGEPGLTTISGIVLDNQDNPLPGVIVRVDGTTRQAIVDDKGLFKITEAPVGPVHLVADGTTTTVAGEYPSLSYNIVTVSGVDNPLSSPIYMVKLNLANAKQAGATDVTITLPDVPGFKLEVPAGSVTFPGGSKEGLLSVTTVNSSKMPMLPPNGMQPQFIVTIQPTGAMFDPPARLTMPNVDGHEPGRQVEMFSYDHDLEEFVAIGLGTVSEDGSVITSNPGVGVVKAGWHCNAQPGGDGCCHGPTPPECNECQKLGKECGAACEMDESKNGLPVKEDKKCLLCDNGGTKNARDKTQCEDGAGACDIDRCVSGECDHTDVEPVTPNAFDTEHPDGLDKQDMTADTQQAYDCLAKSAKTILPISYFRPPDYQSHLLDVYKKQELILGYEEAECAQVFQNINDEYNFHKGFKRKPAVESNHSNGESFDAVVNFPAGTDVSGVLESCHLKFSTDPSDTNHYSLDLK